MAPANPSISIKAGVNCSDVLIVGAGIVGLSLALELRRQGASVTVLERTTAFSGASSAAAGMLAAEDPHNPPALLPLSRFSLSLYENYLARLQDLSGQAVPFQTSLTHQYTAGGVLEFPEHSIDPRQLGSSLLAASQAASVHLVEHAPLLTLVASAAGVEARTAGGSRYSAEHVVHTTGAWAALYLDGLALVPRKGQMLRVAMTAASPLRDVHRAEHIYVVPRTSGPQAGSALIGATVEDAGFDLTTDSAQLAQLRRQAAGLAPGTAFVAEARFVEAWAGTRPYTPDFLPLLGPLRDREWVATGHFRNGILLAPGTAAILADMLIGKTPGVDAAPFAPLRFGQLR